MRLSPVAFYMLAVTAAVWAQSVTIDVPGTGDLWLAGAPAGTVNSYSGGTTAPLNSPVLVNLAFRPSEALSFDATGVVRDPGYPAYGSPTEPNGSSDGNGYWDYRGLSGVTAPQYGLLGVFVSDSIDSSAPPRLEFSAGARELTTVSPLLQQVFYIGQGKNKLGETKSFTAPAGATRLYLGIFGGHSRITGAYRVNVSISDVRGYFPQVADGGSWRTAFILLNTGVKPAPYRLKLYRDNGSEFALPLQPGSAPLQGTIPVGGSVNIISLGTSQGVTTQGWAVLSGSTSLEGMAVFRQQLPGTPDFEAAVLLTRSERELWVPFDQTVGYTSGIAIANTEPVAQTVTAEFFDDRGLPLGTSAIPLAAFGHTAFALGGTNAPAGSPAGGNGVMHLRGEGTQRLVLLGLRFNWTGPFTSLPVFKPE